jgi:hypothetical protein
MQGIEVVIRDSDSLPKPVTLGRMIAKKATM